MAKDRTWQTSAATLFWLLGFAGFAILLAGIASLQQSCGNVGNNNAVLGSVNYLAAVPCDRFFSFDWFIVFFHFFVWLLVAGFLFSRKTNVARPLVTSMLAVASILVIFQTNTWYRPWSGLGDVTSSTFFKRAKVAFAGAMICAIADLGLLMLLGVSAEREDEEPRRTYKETGEAGTGGAHTVGVHAGHPPGERYEAGTTTTMGAAPAETTAV